MCQTLYGERKWYLIFQLSARHYHKKQLSSRQYHCDVVVLCAVSETHDSKVHKAGLPGSRCHPGAQNPALHTVPPTLPLSAAKRA